MFLTELRYPVTGSGNEVFGNGDCDANKVVHKEGLHVKRNNHIMSMTCTPTYVYTKSTLLMG